MKQKAIFPARVRAALFTADSKDHCRRTSRYLKVGQLHTVRPVCLARDKTRFIRHLRRNNKRNFNVTTVDRAFSSAASESLVYRYAAETSIARA